MGELFYAAIGAAIGLGIVAGIVRVMVLRERRLTDELVKSIEDWGGL